MKKLLSMLLAAAVLLTSLAIPISAEGPMAFSLVVTSGAYDHGTDETITVDLVVTNNQPGHVGANLYIDIPDGLELNGTTKRAVKDGDVIADADVFLAEFADGGTSRLAIGYMVADEQYAFNTDGTIATITFKVAEGATEDSDFDLKLGFLQVKPLESDEVSYDDENASDYVTFPEAPTEIEMGECTHPDVVEVEGKDPTCTDPGYGPGKVCAFCGTAIGDTETIPALGHDWKYDSTIEEATCSNVGKDLYKCSRCGETEEREVAKLDHTPSTDYKHDDDSHWTYCTVCGEQIGDKEPHEPDSDWHGDDASVGGHYHVCAVCKAPVGVEDHVDEDADGECDICGAALHEHVADTSKWLFDDEGHYHACTVPGCKAKLDKTAHDTKVEITKEATCTEKGTKTTTCTVCDYEKTEDIDMIPHTPDEDWHTEEGSATHWHVCTVCGTKLEDTAVAHTYGEYTATETEHTHVCTACGATETAKHTGGTATCTKKAVCEVCSTEYGEVDKTNHADGIDETAWESDGTNHWHVCKYCGEKTGVDTHKGGKATCTKAAVCEICSTEYGEVDKTNHGDGIDVTVWETDGTNHWHVCKYCGEKTDVAAHTESEDVKHDGTNHWHYCTVCAYEYEKTAHTSTGEIICDSTGHWMVCSDCGEKFGFDPHSKAVLTPEKKPTYTQDGNVAFWFCPDCGKYFFDNAGKIGAGPYDVTDQFVIKHEVGCNGVHQLVCVPVGASGHMFICLRQCGFVVNMPHNLGINGVCTDCGYVVTTNDSYVGTVTEVEAPTAGRTVVETVETVD